MLNWIQIIRKKLMAMPVGLLWMGVAFAAVVTAAQVADAIRNSPTASPWLRANADAVGSLAMFESGGRTDVYNGSCCYGVLQMNRANIRRYAQVSYEEFRNWPLQRQVDAWSRLTNDAMNNQIVRGFIAMGTFDGRPVDGNLVLACVQLGIGNCQRMIRSGRCSGFADRNGTTICHMADRIAGRNPTTTPAPITPPNPNEPGTGTPAPTGPTYNFDCVRGENGGCMSMSEAMQAGFESGTGGVTMDRVRKLIQLLLVAITMLVVGSAMLGVWRNYTVGAILKTDMMLYMQRGLIIVGMIFVVMSLF